MRSKQYLEQAVLQFPNSILGWTLTKIVHAVAGEVWQRWTIEEMSRANEERKFVNCLFFVTVCCLSSVWLSPNIFYDKSVLFRVAVSHFLSQYVIILNGCAAFCGIVKSSAAHADFRIPAMPKKRGTAGNLRVSFCLVRCYSGSARRWEKWKI